MTLLAAALNPKFAAIPVFTPHPAFVPPCQCNHHRHNGDNACQWQRCNCKSPSGAAISVAELIGRNARQIRKEAGATLKQMDEAISIHGLNWSTGRVADFEAGRVSPNIKNLIAVIDALSGLAGKPLRLSDLLAGDEETVVVKPARVVTAKTLREVLA